MFPGSVYSEGLPHGRADATIRVQGENIEAVVRDGPTFSLPARDAVVESGGRSGRMWFCHNADRSLTIMSEAHGFADALQGVPSLQAQVRAHQARGRQGEKRGRRWLVLGLFALFALLLAAYFGVRGAAALALNAVPVSVDQAIGDQVIESMDLGGSRVHDATVRAGLDHIVQRLSEHARPTGFRFKVRVVDAPTVNAFALPGGHMVVYTGLLRAARDPSEVAGVLGHEMAHVTRRHGMRGLVHALGVTALITLVLGDVSGLSALAVEMLKTGTLTSYGRDQEREADLEGARMVHAAGIDPRGLARFFATLEREGPKVPGALAWLSSHPHSAERRQAIEAHARALGPVSERPLDLDWQELQRRAGTAAGEGKAVPDAPRP